MINQIDELRSKIGCLPMDDSVICDNLAIALCTYFKRHPDRPDNDEEGEHGWGLWVEEQCNKTLNKIALAAAPFPPAKDGMSERERKLVAAAWRSLNWLASYPGGLSDGTYNQMREALAAYEEKE